MTRKIFNLAIPEGQYTDRNGNEKTNWATIGAMFETDNGRRFLTLKRTFNPAGIVVDDKNKENIIINLFSADDKRGY